MRLKMRRNGLFILLGFLFVFFQKAEGDLARNGNLIWNAGYLFRTLLISLAAGALLGYAAGEAVRAVSERRKAQDAQDAIKWLLPGWAFAVVFLLLVLSRIPAYLAYYPGICSYDMDVQTGQIVDQTYNDHHPIAHTLLIRAAMSAGKVFFGEVNAGIGVYAFLQILFLAGAFTYGCFLLNRQRVPPVIQILTLLYGMFYPFHWYMSVTVTKDAVFSGFFLLQILSLYDILGQQRNAFRPGGRDALLFISTVGMILFRNNGKYAMLALLLSGLLAVWRDGACRKLQGRIFASALLAFAVGNLCVSLLFQVTKAGQGDRREMLSMPIQQFARCMIYHGGVGALAEDDNTMAEEDKALIRDFLLNESYLEYRPDIADPVKRHTNTYVARYRAEDFLRTYLRLFAAYPGDYLNAALAVNAGYLAVGDTSHAFINVNGKEKGLGYVQTRWVEDVLRARGIYKDSRWRSLYDALETWADANGHLGVPILKYLFVPGVYLWLYLLLAVILLARKKLRMLLPLSLVLGYYMTLFLGPAVQLRYLYPLMLALPFAAALAGKTTMTETRKG